MIGRGAEFAQLVIERLAHVEIRATWEYPGHLLVRVPGSYALAYGFDGSTWYGHRVTEDGDSVGCAVPSVDNTAPPETVKWANAAEIAEVIRRWFQALLPPCEHGLAWNLRCPDGCADVDVHGRILDPRGQAHTADVALRMHTVRELAAAQGLDPANLFPVGPGAISMESPPCPVRARAPEPRKVGPAAYVDARTTFRVLVYMRPPKEGECGWCVDRDATPEAALASVLAGRESMDVGEYGFGWIADHDQPEHEPDGSRNITITVEKRDDDADGAVLL